MNAEGSSVALELLFVFAGSQLIAQDVRKDEEQNSKTKPDNIKVFSRTFFLMFYDCNVNKMGVLSYYFCSSLFWEVFSLLTVNYFCIVLNAK